MSGANEAVLDARRDLDRLGPATREAIRIGDKALKDGIEEHEAKLRLRSLNSLERRYHERELREHRAALDTLWSQPYPPPYEPGSRTARPPTENGSMPG